MLPLIFTGLGPPETYRRDVPKVYLLLLAEILVNFSDHSQPLLGYHLGEWRNLIFCAGLANDFGLRKGRYSGESLFTYQHRYPAQWYLRD